ncbi:MAG: aminotransferase class I/II-fold pyridoxal phosphate-dependent enzyme [Acidobacteriota bacterium]
MTRAVVAAMTAYTLELREAETKLNQNESPYDVPLAIKEEILARAADRPWNIYPDFESTDLRAALAAAWSMNLDEILVGNGSNELLAAAIGAFVGPGTPVLIPRPTFSLYEKLVTIAEGVAIPVAIDPATGLLPVDQMLHAIATARSSSPANADGSPAEVVVIVCSPNNPTGGVLPPGGLQLLLDSGAMILFDRAYGDFALDTLPALHEHLVTFSTFSKAWGLAALRLGWLASTAKNCREIRKVKLPYSLNVISEAIAVTALQHPELRDHNVAATLAERERMAGELTSIDGVEPFPSQANFLCFRVAGDARRLFNQLHARSVLIRDISSAVPDSLRVSIGSPEQNDRFLDALRDSLRENSAPGASAREDLP